MAVAVGANPGVFQTILRVADDGSAVIKSFAQNAQRDLGAVNQAVSQGGGDLETAGKQLVDVGKAAQEAKDQLGKVHVELGKANAEVGKTGQLVQATGKELAAAPAALDDIHKKTLLIGGAIGAAGAALAVFTAALNAGLRNAESIGNLAKQAGVGVEAFSALAFHAEQSELSAAQLAKAFFTLEKNLATIARSGKGAEVFEEIGLDVARLVKLKPERAFEAIADAVAQVEDPFRRAEVLQKIFGISSRNMVEALEGGSAAIREHAREAQALGAIVSSDTAQNAKAFYDDLGKLGTALGSIGNLLAGNLSDDLRKLSGALVFLAKDSALLKAFGEALSVAATGVLFVARVAATVAVALTGVVGDIGRALGGLLAALDAIKRGEFGQAFGIIKETIRDIGEKSKQTEETLRGLWGLIENPPKTDALKKSAFEAGQATAGLVRTAFGGAAGSGTFSDVLPGAQTTDGFDDEAQDERNARREDQERDHQQRIYALRSRYHELSLESAVHYNQLNLDSAAYFFSQLGALMGTKSRALFEVGKAGAIAETIVNTYRAAQGAYAALAGIPIVGPALGAAAAAAAIAAGLARVAAIRSTQFGATSASPVLTSGGLSGPVTSGNTGTALPPAPVNAPPPPAREINVTLNGSAFSAQSVRDELIPLFNEASADGVPIRINVRNA